jgi:hypothetical protein
METAKISDVHQSILTNILKKYSGKEKLARGGRRQSGEGEEIRTEEMVFQL